MVNFKFVQRVGGILLMVIATSTAAEYHTAVLTLTEGLPYVTVEMLGCGECPKIDFVLDTGASTSVIPTHQIQQLEDELLALESGDATVVMADHDSMAMKTYLLNGFVIAGCKVELVAAISSPGTSGQLVPILGMDLLDRLEQVRISLDDEHRGTLSFTCPQGYPEQPCTAQ